MSLSMRLVPALLALLGLLSGCVAPVDDPEAGDGHSHDEESLGVVAQELSTFSCKAHQDTGYKSGKAFKITVVKVDGKPVERDTANAYYFMAKAASKAGINLQIISGFRSMAEQKYLYNCYKTCSCNGCNLAATPGYSNHQSGSALDLNTSAPGVYGWMSKHAKKFGFYRTVPSEAWHWEYKGKRPVGGPCGKLGAKLVKAWTDLKKDPAKSADYQVCAGKPFQMWFTYRNTGTSRWASMSKGAKYVGERVKLRATTDKDKLSGLKAVSLADNANSNVLPKSWGGGAGKGCSDKDGCQSTVFTKKGIKATAPAKPGVYTTSWRLTDYSPASKGKGFGPTAKLKIRVSDCAPPGGQEGGGQGGSQSGGGQGGQVDDGQSGAGGQGGSGGTPDEASGGGGQTEGGGGFELDDDLGLDPDEEDMEHELDGEPAAPIQVDSGCSMGRGGGSGSWLGLALLGLGARFCTRRPRKGAARGVSGVHLGTLVALLSLLGCTAPVDRDWQDEEVGSVEQEVKPPTKAYCSIPVIGKGTKDMEKDYLPHVITCENGGANKQALEAQAIAARSVAYYAMATQGKICDGQGCQVYSCGANPSDKAKAAVKATAGIYLAYGGMLTYGFYVDGNPNSSPPSCHGGSNWPTEKYVTYNQGKKGKAVKQTSLGYIGPPGYGQNRGCMSQWGGRCLENKKGYDRQQILRFYYGADIGMPQAKGACVVTDDKDGDGVKDKQDNCPSVKNSGQKDTDKDGKGDACDADDDNDGVKDTNDNCPKQKNPDQSDSDKDGKGDACDPDDDNDGVKDSQDNCPKEKNKSQLDTDNDGKGDACDGDDDGDDVPDAEDNCPKVNNADQLDSNGDGQGDACVADDDGDGILDAEDNCPATANADQLDTDQDGVGDACEDDTDGDGVPDASDLCPTVADPEQGDANKNGIGDACDNDDDGDGVEDAEDDCPADFNPEQTDLDEDGLGDACDDDDDGDGVLDDDDNCPSTPNPGQDPVCDGDADQVGESADPEDITVHGSACSAGSGTPGSSPRWWLLAAAGLAFASLRRRFPS